MRAHWITAALVLTLLGVPSMSVACELVCARPVLESTACHEATKNSSGARLHDAAHSCSPSAVPAVLTATGSGRGVAWNVTTPALAAGVPRPALALQLAGTIHAPPGSILAAPPSPIVALRI